MRPLVCRLRRADRAPLRLPVKRHATFNEPSVLTLLGYCLGGQPPAVSDHTSLLQAIHHVNLRTALRSTGCARASAVLRSGRYNCQPCRPAREGPEHLLAAQKLDAYWNGAFPDPQLLGKYPALLADAMAPHVQPDDLARSVARSIGSGSTTIRHITLLRTAATRWELASGRRRPMFPGPAWAGRWNPRPSGKP